MQRADTFFTPAEGEQIRQAVAAAETATAGEIVTMVVDSSDTYRESETLGATLLAGFVAIVIAVAMHHVTIWSYIPMVFMLYFPCRLLFRSVPRLKLSFVGRRRLHEAVRERAVRAFYEKGLYRTRGATGILIFISLLERKVWILGDRGINEKIAPHFWNEIAVTLTKGLREGEGGAALCRAIAACGAELSRHFPRAADDTDELPNDLLTQDG
ncbi:TPM domain-containing protein [Geobacter pickeringii]|uniref:TPM domain-containing protein n=1 Tax=Geobacter pickeringii TaxID=345632 RepID=A0A0B5B9N2_9BACT|nr:TPM domain-containing protein [Geobacter pickeringii]AJE03418.1 hypothetical protein GPICK_08670 [Geobacter pickeringii]